ncbi:MAG TPA: hypothetical protein VHD56_04770, partial [Tepidisphaeraceae bacterium]|nr:hypothetical protein [Tepidisphaeraceae bacterium]
MRLLLHGLGVDLACESRGLLAPLSDALGEFGVESFEAGVAPIHGAIRPYQQHEVLRYLSNSAVRLNGPNELVEIYQQDERFWMIDDRWGLCELNVLKGNFRSWVLETAPADANWIVE